MHGQAFQVRTEEEGQDEVHRDEADADAEELALVEAALGPPHVAVRMAQTPTRAGPRTRRRPGRSPSRKARCRCCLKCRDLCAVHCLPPQSSPAAARPPARCGSRRPVRRVARLSARGGEVGWMPAHARQVSQQPQVVEVVATRPADGAMRGAVRDACAPARRAGAVTGDQVELLARAGGLGGDGAIWALPQQEGRHEKIGH